jgi:hypothetical protein
MARFDVEISFAAQLDWIRTFVAEEVEPLDLAVGGEEILLVRSHPIQEAVVPPLQDRGREQGLWSCHLTPALGHHEPGRRSDRGAQDVDRARRVEGVLPSFSPLAERAPS